MDLVTKMVVEEEGMSDRTAEGCAEAEQAEQVEDQMVQWASQSPEQGAAGGYYYLKEEEEEETILPAQIVKRPALMNTPSLTCLTSHRPLLKTGAKMEMVEAGL